ncbi:MAG: DUF1292 domain-containing protein [Clostridiaceae bacterium]|jgi:uncharacterized protein YrzB (UPF0473 family)|nr:DUF1292 domain-containing protein [Clostridiaceae bacterium]
MADENQIIETTDEQGNVFKFELYDVIDFEDKEYALLVPIEAEEASDDEEIVIMRLTQEGDEYSFETIDNEDEFNNVKNYIEAMGDELGEEE